MSTTIIKRKRPVVAPRRHVVFIDEYRGLSIMKNLTDYDINKCISYIMNGYDGYNCISHCYMYYIYQEDMNIIINGKCFTTYIFVKPVPGTYIDTKDIDNQSPKYAITEYDSKTWEFSDEPFQ